MPCMRDASITATCGWKTDSLLLIIYNQTSIVWGCSGSAQFDTAMLRRCPPCQQLRHASQENRPQHTRTYCSPSRPHLAPLRLGQAVQAEGQWLVHIGAAHEAAAQEVKQLGQAAGVDAKLQLLDLAGAAANRLGAASQKTIAAVD